jgi:predicted TPR repeat methyltransferase
VSRRRLESAIALVRDGSLDSAEVLLGAVLADTPDQPDALHLLGLVRHERGDAEQAEALLRRAIANWPAGDPQVAIAWNNLGNVLVECGRIESALAAYRASASAAPTAPAAWGNLANLLRRLGRLDQAEPAARSATEHAPEDPEAWFTLARVLIEQGQVAAGLEANARGIALAPSTTLGRDQVLRALVLLGRHADAAVLCREWLATHPDDPVARHQLAAIDAGEPPARAGDEYVTAVFDEFASTFDAKLTALGYRAPQLVADVLDATGLGDVVDLGCGTGLVGELLAERARRLVGVDLSVAMLREARRRGVYNELFRVELVEFLRHERGSFDTIVSADTLCYFGDLGEFAAAASAALRPGGRLVFTVEALRDPAGRGWELTPTGRYAHDRAYIERVLAAFGRVVVRPDHLRNETGRPVDGFVVSAGWIPSES